jgi:hypothetical protein
MWETGDHWQAKLEAHFLALAGRRPPKLAVFGLEHGLEPAEFVEVQTFVRSHARLGLRRDKHWLLWIVYASEIGYHYAGEYWQSFAQQMPGWDNNSREWIPEIFHKFHGQFGGPRPTGAWAGWFPIIAWPIANAILPADLQRHLARALYEVRSGLVDHLEDPADLGQFIADNARPGSDRFDKLTEQPVLLGQIALALLRPEAIGDEVLFRSTLRRIALDLEKQRQAADWLKSARRSAEEPSFRAGGRKYAPAAAPSSRDDAERVRTFAKTSAPRVFLRQEDSEERHWGVRLRLPYLGSLIELSHNIRSAVLGSRCWAPAAEAPIARGRLLRDSQELALIRWPKPYEPLIRFLDLSAGLESALLSEWVMASPPWLFGIRADGTAVELKSIQVRPGNRYIFASISRVPSDERLIPLETECKDVSLYELNVPKILTSEWLSFIRYLGLQPARTVKVWPTGFVPAEWDGESRAQWLLGDLVMFGIRADHPIEELQCQLDGAESVVIPFAQESSSSFLELPDLAVGSHMLRMVEVERGAEQASTTITIEIREPRKTPPEQAGPLMVWVEPYSTSLDELWEGAIAICAEGLTEQQGRCEVTLAEYAGGRQLAHSTAANVHFPMSANDWRSLFRTHLQSAGQMETAYDEAGWAQVAFEVGIYGRYALEFDRQLPPVRWRLRQENGSYVLQLGDDSESRQPPTIQYADFHEPDQWKPIVADTSEAEINAAPNGGIYVAKVGSRTATIIVPPSTRAREQLHDPLLAVKLVPTPVKAETLASLVLTMQRWAIARLPGDPLIRAWRSRIVRQLQNSLFSRLCGRDWAQAEATLARERNRTSYDKLQRMVVQTRDDRMTVAGALVADWARICPLPVEERVNYLRMLTRRGPGPAGIPGSWLVHLHGGKAADWAAEFALRTASDTEVAAWVGGSLPDALDILIRWPLLARTARCLVLSSLIGQDKVPQFPPLFPEWVWRGI